jgi:hypothetical protein
MVNINGREYYLCLFDTNALSDFLKDTKRWIKYLQSDLTLDKHIISYSAFSIAEITNAPSILNMFIAFFSHYPSVILDGYESIFQKEIDLYTGKSNQISPMVVAPFAVKSEKPLAPEDRLFILLKKSGLIKKAKYWNRERDHILQGILSLKKNYPPQKGSKYSKKEIETFVQIASVEQIMRRDINFAKVQLDKGSPIDVFKFPSIIATSYTVFYKFYVDNKKPKLSDVFDIIISSLLPYVDIVITEGHLCEIIRKVQEVHGYLSLLRAITIKKVKERLASFV